VSTFRHTTVATRVAAAGDRLATPQVTTKPDVFPSMAVSAPFSGSGRDLSSKSCVGA
jgi:hypothetical protein